MKIFLNEKFIDAFSDAGMIFSFKQSIKSGICEQASSKIFSHNNDAIRDVINNQIFEFCQLLLRIEACIKKTLIMLLSIIIQIYTEKQENRMSWKRRQVINGNDEKLDNHDGSIICRSMRKFRDSASNSTHKGSSSTSKMISSVNAFEKMGFAIVICTN